MADKKFTNTTLFLLPALNILNDDLSKAGFINAYLGDNGYEIEYKNSLYLLFKPSGSSDIEDFIDKYKEVIHDDYNIGDHVMIVFKFPKDFIKEYKYFKQGKYSKFSKTYINLYFPFSKETKVDGKVIKEHTLFYHIFNKTKWIKDWWNTRLGYDNEHELKMDEWWDIPNEEKEVYRYKNNK